MKYIVILFLLFSSTAYAVCSKSWVCDDYGNNCQVIDVCDSPLDLPGTNIPPLRPLPTLEVKPLPSMSIPPIGTNRCEYMQVNGRWQNICY